MDAEKLKVYYRSEYSGCEVIGIGIDIDIDIDADVDIIININKKC